MKYLLAKRTHVYRHKQYNVIQGRSMLYNHVIDDQDLVMKDKKGRNIKHKYTVLNAFSKMHGIEKWYFMSNLVF